MDLWSFVQSLDVAMRIAIASACALAGLVLLWNDRRRELAVARPAPLELKLQPMATARASTERRSECLQVTSEYAYGRLRARIAEASERAQRMNSCQQGASRQLDTAEVALRRLVDEISAVMPVNLSTSTVLRRPAPVAPATVRALAAA